MNRQSAQNLITALYPRLSRDDKEKMEESNSIKNQRLLIQHFVENQPEFAGAKFFFFVDDGYSGTTFVEVR